MSDETKICDECGVTCGKSEEKCPKCGADFSEQEEIANAVERGNKILAARKARTSPAPAPEPQPVSATNRMRALGKVVKRA